MRSDGSGGVSGIRYYGEGAVRVDGRLTWFSSDHHATSQVATAAADLSVIRRRLKRYSNDRAASIAWPGDRGFVGGTRDHTGLTHLGARE